MFLLVLNEVAGYLGHIPAGLLGQNPRDIGHMPAAEVLPWQSQRAHFVNCQPSEARRNPRHAGVWAYGLCDRQPESITLPGLEIRVGFSLGSISSRGLALQLCSGASQTPLPADRLRSDRCCRGGFCSFPCLTSPPSPEVTTSDTATTAESAATTSSATTDGVEIAAGSGRIGTGSAGTGTKRRAASISLRGGKSHLGRTGPLMGAHMGCRQAA